MTTKIVSVIALVVCATAWTQDANVPPANPPKGPPPGHGVSGDPAAGANVPGRPAAGGAGKGPKGPRPNKPAGGAGAKTVPAAETAGRETKEKPTAEASGKGTDQELDFIEMNTGDKMYGKIHSEIPDSVILMVNDGNGRIKVPKSKIMSLNFSMDTRLKALEEDDYAGQYKVGLWAMEKNMYPQAIKLFESLKGQEGVNGDLLKQLGKAYELRGQLDKALAAYKEYALGNPEDADAAATIARLDKEVNPVVPEAAKPAAPKIVEGLEADGKWFAETWDNANPVTVGPTKDAQNGNNMIAATSPGGLKDKMAFSRIAQPLDLSQSSDMVFKIFNKSESSFNLAVAFVNAKGDFHESKLIRIPAKSWENQSFKIEGKVFKSSLNNFEKWDQELAGREHIGKIVFLVYNAPKGFTLYLDSLFFKEAKPAN